ncbi:MAG TPA: LLM class flavin-dependent oxidoreductase, partial [Paenirhodobacter sp.]
SSPSLMTRFEPLTFFSALAMSTRHIGLVATLSTSYMAPYNAARLFASLDHLSEGRAGWNIVTSSSLRAAQNFGLPDQESPAVRYERAEEFVEVVKGLWDSWEDGALPQDKDSGVYLDPTKLHELDHSGKYFSVRGPLNVDRTPQGQPVLVQAGSSAGGMALGARVAEVIFTAQPTLDEGRKFYSEMKQGAIAAGRDPSQILIMPGVMPIVGRTHDEAQALFEELQSRIDIKLALSVLSDELGHDVSGYPLDAPLPDLPPTIGTISRAELLMRLAREQNLTLAQLARSTAAARGHHVIVGSPTEIVDILQEWFETGAADGFNIMPPFFPRGLELFVDLVVPELQKRGLFRTAYEGNTLRENLGLAVPQNRYTAQRQQDLAPAES